MAILTSSGTNLPSCSSESILRDRISRPDVFSGFLKVLTIRHPLHDVSHHPVVVVPETAYEVQSDIVNGFHDQHPSMAAPELNATISRDFYWSMSSDSYESLLAHATSQHSTSREAKRSRPTSLPQDPPHSSEYDTDSLSTNSSSSHEDFSSCAADSLSDELDTLLFSSEDFGSHNPRVQDFSSSETPTLSGPSNRDLDYPHSIPREEPLDGLSGLEAVFCQDIAFRHMIDSFSSTFEPLCTS